MQLSFKKRLTRFVGISIAGFLVFFIFRFVYGFTTGASEYGEEYISDFFSDLEDVKHNYASDRYTYVKSEAHDDVARIATQDAASQHQVDVTQKYEKTATVKSKSVKFEEEEKRLREKIKDRERHNPVRAELGRQG